MVRMSEAPKKRTFRTFSYRGIDLDALLDLKPDALVDLLPARQRRKFHRGMKRQAKNLMLKLRNAKKAAGPMEKPATVKTHLRNMIVLPEMIGSVAGVYNGKTFITVEIKPEMVGYYLGEFAITYKPPKHGRAGVGAGGATKFLALK